MSLKIFILSPHFDDAAYALTLHISGIIKSGIPLTVINCFTITSWTAFPVEAKGTEDISLMRQDEDIAYYRQFNADVCFINLNLLDAPLRNNYIFKHKALEPEEWRVVTELKTRLEEHVDGILLCPLGIGDHIDHVICKEAIIQLYGSMRTVFYEDLPYAARITFPEIESYVTDLEQRLNVKLKSQTYDQRKCDISKELAIGVYKSQLKDEFCGEIIAHMHRLSGERLWGEIDLLDILNIRLNC